MKPNRLDGSDGMGETEEFSCSGLNLRGTMAGPVHGQPVFLLHGGGQTRYSWKRTQDLLANAGFLAVAVDLRGHGESDWASPDRYTLRDFAADTRCLLERFERPPAVIGASLGGISTLLAVGEAPYAPLAALVLVDIVPRIEEDGVKPITAFMRARPDGFATVEEAADMVAAYLPHRPRPSDTSGLMKNLRRRTDGRLIWHWDPAYIDVAGLEESSDARAGRLEAAASRISAPTLLVRGLRSEVVTDEALKAFRAVMPEAAVVDIQDAAHMVAGDRNDIFGDAIMHFLGNIYQLRAQTE